MSGRDTNVAFGLELFVEHPSAGMGFGRSGRLADEAVGHAIHNCYIVLLAELGAPLFAILAIIMIGAVWDWESLGMIVSFMVVFLMVSSRAINMSLPTMLFWAFVARSWIFAAPAAAPTVDTPKYLTLDVSVPKGTGPANGTRPGARSTHGGFIR
jgi:O-antigen ligase